MKKEQGITLTSLVIMIIILLILASITTYSGASTVRYTKFLRAQTGMQIMQTQVNSWYEQVNNGNIEVENYGEDFTETTYSTAFAKAGVTDTSNYKLFTEDYIASLGIDGVQDDFLISITDRTVILAEGITYQDVTYYTAEDFGISNVESNPISRITFDLDYGTNPDKAIERDLFIYNIKFYDSEGNEVTVNKYKIECYKKSNGYSEEVTNTITYSGVEAYYIQITSSDDYTVKVSTEDGKVSAENSLTVDDIIE